MQQSGIRGSWLRAFERPFPYTYVLLVLAGIVLECVIHIWSSFSGVFTQFYYLFVILAGLWYGRRAVAFALLYSFLLILDSYILTGTLPSDALVQACMFVIIALVVGMTAEQSARCREWLTAQNRDLADANSRLEESHNAVVIANKKLNLLSSITRHSIRNQLIVLAGFIGLARMKTTDPDILHYIAREEEAALVIHEQIEFTKLYEDIGIRAPQWQDVGKQIHALRPLVPRGEIQISIAVENLEVFADPLLDKIFENLIDNSRRHGEHVRHISVSVLRDNPHSIALMYADDGVGIRDADKERIFAKGFGRNTGFGLFLAREVLAITEIEIKEIGVHGHGARFEIRIPDGKYRFSSSREQKGSGTSTGSRPV